MFEAISLEKIVSNTKEMNSRFPLALLNKALLITGSILVLGYLTLQPPARYPFLFEAMISVLVFIVLIILGMYSNLKQWSSSFNKQEFVGKKKLH
jgi:alpha-1,3-glucosyltransferase